MRRLRTPLIHLFMLAIVIPGAAVPACAGGSNYSPSDAERARWTMSDMRSWATALAAYHQDNGSYPRADSIEALTPFVQPSYIRKAPLTDAWGTAFRYVVADDQKSFRIISAGADGAFDEKTWSTKGTELGFQEDAVRDPLEFTRVWQYR